MKTSIHTKTTPTHIPRPPEEKLGKDGAGQGEEQRRKGLPAQWLTMVQDRTNKSWSKDAPNTWLQLKNKLTHFWFIAVRPKKKYLSQIHINTRLQLLYYHYFLKFFPLVFARPRYLITIYIHSATTTRGRHRAWKSFSVSTSMWVVHRIPLTLHVESDHLPAFSKS